MSERLLAALNSAALNPAFSADEASAISAQLAELLDAAIYPRSLVSVQNSLLFLTRAGIQKQVGCLSYQDGLAGGLGGAHASVTVDGVDLALTLTPTDAESAAELRSVLPYLVAEPLGLRKSAGCGDRLGLATPGHIRAFRSSFGADAPTSMMPILTQQSIRENVRTGRTPQEVMDDAVWGVFQEGWRDGFGADADHLKTTDDVDVCAAAGYTFFTVDPGDHVDDSANTVTENVVRAKVDALPWQLLDSSPADLVDRLADRGIDLGELAVTMSQEEVLRAAAKYGQAIAHTVTMSRHLDAVMGDRPHELEMSVDETATVTSLVEHVYIANELRRLGIRCVSLAPRYVGAFEKGADYIGDLAAFEASFREHLAVSQTFGPYKLSLHSGSDKFSIYPIAARVAGELVHLKTAGTSYLEAVRAIAVIDPSLFRRIVAFGLQRYPTDRASYHVSAEVDKAPDIRDWPDAELPAVLDDFHMREILHVTFGSVLHHADFRAPFFAALRGHEETYYEVLEVHFNRHFAPFARSY